MHCIHNIPKSCRDRDKELAQCAGGRCWDGMEEPGRRSESEASHNIGSTPAPDLDGDGLQTVADAVAILMSSRWNMKGNADSHPSFMVRPEFIRNSFLFLFLAFFAANVLWSRAKSTEGTEGVVLAKARSRTEKRPAVSGRRVPRFRFQEPTRSWKANELPNVSSLAPCAPRRDPLGQLHRLTPLPKPILPPPHGSRLGPTIPGEPIFMLARPRLPIQLATVHRMPHQSADVCSRCPAAAGGWHRHHQP